MNLGKIIGPKAAKISIICDKVAEMKEVEVEIFMIVVAMNHIHRSFVD